MPGAAAYTESPRTHELLPTVVAAKARKAMAFTNYTYTVSIDASLFTGWFLALVTNAVGLTPALSVLAFAFAVAIIIFAETGGLRAIISFEAFHAEAPPMPAYAVSRTFLGTGIVALKDRAGIT